MPDNFAYALQTSPVADGVDANPSECLFTAWKLT